MTLSPKLPINEPETVDNSKTPDGTSHYSGALRLPICTSEECCRTPPTPDIICPDGTPTPKWPEWPVPTAWPLPAAWPVPVMFFVPDIPAQVENAHDGTCAPSENYIPFDDDLLVEAELLHDAYVGANSQEKSVCASSAGYLDGHNSSVHCLSRTITGDSATSATSAELGLSDVVHTLASCTQGLHARRQELFSLIEVAARDALGEKFESLVLVGSAALNIDTPLSDLDAIVFTQQHKYAEQREDQISILRGIVQKLQARSTCLQVQVLEWARVPILSACFSQRNISIDVSVDQELGVSHWQWFLDFGVGSLKNPTLTSVPTPIAEDGATTEALFLRCVKWWLVRRNIPSTKQGGFPTIVWNFMAAHVHKNMVHVNVCSSKPERRSRRLLRSLSAFFTYFYDTRGFHGTIRFGQTGETSFEPLLPNENVTPSKAETELSELAQRSTFFVNWSPPDEINKDILDTYFKWYGSLNSIHLPTDQLGHPKGYAFITMASRQEMEAVLSEKNHFAAGTKLGVNSITKEKSEIRSQLHVRVRNINFKTSEDELRKHFAQFGVVSKVFIEKDPSNGKSRGFGYVIIADAASDGVIIAAPHSLHGRQLHIQIKKNETLPQSQLLSSFSVLDPSTEADLAPKISKATQLLHLYEMRRAAMAVECCATNQPSSRGNGRARIHELFEPAPKGVNEIPSAWPSKCGDTGFSDNDDLIGALFVSGSSKLVLGVLLGIEARPKWTAPFLLRRDATSKIRVMPCHVQDFNDKCGAICHAQRDKSEVVFTPCDFVCRISLQKIEWGLEGSEANEPITSPMWELCGESLVRYRQVKSLLDTAGYILNEASSNNCAVAPEDTAELQQVHDTNFSHLRPQAESSISHQKQGSEHVEPIGPKRW